MTVSPVASQSAAYSTAAAGSPAAKGYDNDLFMQVILAQLSNQNPMEPLKDAELMSQFTQLNSLSELQTIGRSLAETAASFQAGYASSLIGKHITAGMPDGSTLEGEVSSVLVERQKVYLLVGEKKVALDSVREITEKKPADPEIQDEGETGTEETI